VNNTVVIITAAGLSSRHPPNKLLLKIGKETVIERTVATFIALPVDIIVITGWQSEKVTPVLLDRFGDRITVMNNPAYATGLASSIRAALESFAPRRYSYLAFCNGDRPFIKPQTAAELLKRVEGDTPFIAAPTFDGTMGHPTFFSSSLHGELAAITGDRGGRTLLKKYADRVTYYPVADQGTTWDMDYYLERND